MAGPKMLRRFVIKLEGSTDLGEGEDAVGVQFARKGPVVIMDQYTNIMSVAPSMEAMLVGCGSDGKAVFYLDGPETVGEQLRKVAGEEPERFAAAERRAEDFEKRFNERISLYKERAHEVADLLLDRPNPVVRQLRKGLEEELELRFDVVPELVQLLLSAFDDALEALRDKPRFAKRRREKELNDMMDSIGGMDSIELEESPEEQDDSVDCAVDPMDSEDDET